MKIYLIFALAFFPLLVLSQPKEGQPLIDSLIAQLHVAKNDTNEVKTLFQVSLAYPIVRADKGIEYGMRGLNLARKLKWRKGEAMCHHAIGFNYAYVPDNPKAFENYIQCLNIYEELQDKNGLAKANLLVGHVYNYYNDYRKAIEYYTRALTLNNELSHKRDAAICRELLGNMYAGKGDLTSALKNYKTAIEMFEAVGDMQNAARTNGETGTLFASQKNYRSALEYETKALEMTEKYGTEYYRATNLTNIAQCYLAILNDTSQAADSVLIMLSGNEHHNKAILRKKAAGLLEDALVIAINIRSLDVRYTCYQHLIELLKEDGDYKKALEYVGIFLRLKDTLYSRENEQKVARMAVQTEYDRKLLADNGQLQKQRIYILTGSAGIVLLLCFSFFIVRERGKSERARKKSEALAKSLQESLLQKDLLMKEIHHRVKNNLQVISSLLELQLDNISDATAIAAMTESTSRVRSMSLIHQQLYQYDGITTVDLSKFATDLFLQVSVIFKKQSNSIVLNNNIPESMQDIDTAVPLGLILNELMTNSYKYAFAGTNTGSITISLKHTEGINHLLYTDSGPGLPQDSPIDKSKSLGMRVITNLSKQLGGKLHYDFDTKYFHLIFKDLAERKKVA